MRTLSEKSLNSICITAGITHHTNQNGEIVIMSGNKKIGTFISIENGKSSRFIYPKGHEYTHTSYYGQPLSEATILKAKVNIALDLIRESV